MCCAWNVDHVQPSDNKWPLDLGFQNDVQDERTKPFITESYASQARKGFLQPSGCCTWLLPSLQEQKSNRLAMKGVGFLGLAGGNWRRLGALLQHHQPPPTDPPSPDSTDLKISALSDVTSTPSKTNTVRTLDRRTRWAPRRNNTKASAPFFKEPPLPSTPSFWVWAAPSTTITRWSLLWSELGLDFQRVKKLVSKLHVHAAKLVHNRRALQSFQQYYQPSSGDGFRSSLQPSWSPVIFPFRFAVPK